MSEPIETLSWWSDAVADLKRKKLRDIAREHAVSVKDLQAAIQRTGVMADSGAAVSAPAAGLSASERIALHASSLGKVSDGAFATLAGVSRKTVVQYRKTHGIAAFEAGPGVVSKAPRRGRPAKATAAPRTRARSADAVSAPAGARAPRQSKLDGFLDIVGVLSDKEVAQRAGVTAENVRMYRARRGIAAQWQVDGAPRRGRPARVKAVAPPVSTETVVAPRRRGRPPRVRPPEGAPVAPAATESGDTLVERALAAVLDKVGKVSDAEVATAAGISRSAVSAYRKKHGIAAAGRGGRPPGSRNKPKATPAPAAPATSAAAPAATASAPMVVATGATGWAVTLRDGQGEQVWTVVATDAVDAARKATVAAGGAAVIGLRAVGPILG